MSRGIKLVLMGVAGAALLYSCTPGIGAGLGALPYLWFLTNPFSRLPTTPSLLARRHANPRRPRPRTPSKATSAPQSQRGGFGGTGSTGRLSGTS